MSQTTTAPKLPNTLRLKRDLAISQVRDSLSAVKSEPSLALVRVLKEKVNELEAVLVEVADFRKQPAPTTTED